MNVLLAEMNVSNEVLFLHVFVLHNLYDVVVPYYDVLWVIYIFVIYIGNSVICNQGYVLSVRKNDEN